MNQPRPSDAAGLARNGESPADAYEAPKAEEIDTSFSGAETAAGVGGSGGGVA